MKRFLVAISIASLIFLNSLLSQTEGDADKGKTETTTETTKTDEEKKAGPEAGKDTDATKGDTGSETSTGESGAKEATQGQGIMWTDKNGIRYANSRVQFSLVATDTLSDVDYIEYKIGEKPFVKYSGAFSLQEEGPYTILYRAIDKAGNKEMDQVYNLIIDNNPPKMIIYPARAFHVKNGKNFTHAGNFFTLRVTDDYSGVKTAEFSVNSNTLQKYEGDVIKLTSSGTQFIRYRAEDNLGNKTADNIMVIEVDSEKPNVRIMPSSSLFKVGEKHYARRSTGFKIVGTDTGSGVEQILIRVDGAIDWQTYTDVLFFDTEKEHKIETKAVDAVGNESDIKSITFIVDDNPPVTKLEVISE